MDKFRSVIVRALASASCIDEAHIFPTVLVPLPDRAFRRKPGVTLADIVIAYFRQLDFEADRTTMNVAGYPGRFRELSNPPPWIEVTPEDVLEPISLERAVELRPLYIHANEASPSALMDRYRSHLEDEYRFLGSGIPNNLSDLLLRDFEEDLALARCLGKDGFEQVYETVFEPYDEFRPAVGAPDLFVWHPKTALWFFVEVKGPGDRLRSSQIGWVRSWWSNINGRRGVGTVPRIHAVLFDAGDTPTKPIQIKGFSSS